MPPVRYSADQHYPQIMQWYRARGQPSPKRLEIPNIGLVIPEVAAGFLVHTDTHFALFWGLVSNPQMPKQFREIALTTITTSIADLAQQEGYSHILGLTTQDAVRAYAANQNYQESTVTLVLKELT